ncbi:hypothetical protein ACHHYP_17215 [Achlya hypogyna]|uniref:Uncharacterized protein n=1 Tax=Achlya hypogyna TaxID=1202772 RepID=A0A1V9Y4W9_ACHHY|nr:hypothetical protein ACHHYP_17215 [Achlya hypogyna]
MSRIHLDRSYIKNSELRRVASEIASKFDLSGTFSIQPSHAIWNRGIDTTIAATESWPRGAFAAVAVIHGGGNMLALSCGTYKVGLKNCKPPLGTFVAFSRDCHAVAKPKFSKSHGVIVVYYAIYDDTSLDTRVLRSMSPLTLAIASTACEADHEQAVWSTPVKLDGNLFDFCALQRRDLRIVRALVAANCLDIALVEIGSDNCICSARFLGDSVPVVVQEALLQKPISAFRRVNDAGLEARHFVVFWLRRHRVRVLGFRQAMALAEAAITTPTADTMGYGSAVRLATAIVDMVERPSMAELHGNESTPDHVELVTWLAQLGYERPLRSFALYRMPMQWCDVQNLVASFCDALLPLRIRPFITLMLGLLQRIDTSPKNIAAATALVVSFTQLDIPNAAHLVIRCYRNLLPHLLEMRSDQWDSVDGVAIVTDIVRIEAWLDQTPLDIGLCLGAPAAGMLPVVMEQTILDYEAPVLSFWNAVKPCAELMQPLWHVRHVMPAFKVAAIVTHLTADTSSFRYSCRSKFWAVMLALTSTTDAFPSILREVENARESISVIEVWYHYAILSTKPYDPLVADAMWNQVAREVRMIRQDIGAITQLETFHAFLKLVLKVGLPPWRDLVHAMSKLYSRGQWGSSTRFRSFTEQELTHHLLPTVVAVVTSMPDMYEVLRPMLQKLLYDVAAAMPSPPPLVNWALKSVVIPCDCPTCTNVVAFATDATRGWLELLPTATCSKLAHYLKGSTPFMVADGIMLYKENGAATHKFVELSEAMELATKMLSTEDLSSGAATQESIPTAMSVVEGRADNHSHDDHGIAALPTSPMMSNFEEYSTIFGIADFPALNYNDLEDLDDDVDNIVFNFTIDTDEPDALSELFGGDDNYVVEDIFNFDALTGIPHDPAQEPGGVDTDFDNYFIDGTQDIEYFFDNFDDPRGNAYSEYNW